MTPDDKNAALADEFKRLLMHYADGCLLCTSKHSHIASTDFDAREKAVIDAYLAALHSAALRSAPSERANATRGGIVEREHLLKRLTDLIAYAIEQDEPTEDIAVACLAICEEASALASSAAPSEGGGA
jgi:hypothetical protein